MGHYRVRVDLKHVGLGVAQPVDALSVDTHVDLEEASVLAVHGIRPPGRFVEDDAGGGGLLGGGPEGKKGGLGILSVGSRVFRQSQHQPCGLYCQITTGSDSHISLCERRTMHLSQPKKAINFSIYVLRSAINRRSMCVTSVKQSPFQSVSRSGKKAYWRQRPYHLIVPKRSP